MNKIYIAKTCSKCGAFKASKYFAFIKEGDWRLNSACKECRYAAAKVWREKNKEHIRNYQNNHRKKPEVAAKRKIESAKIRRKKGILERTRLHDDEIKRRAVIRATKYQAANKGKVKLYKKLYERKRRKNIEYRILKNYRKRVWDALKGNCKSSGTKELVGCSIEFLLLHLRSLFTDGMTMDNYGEWHVDHRIPCASFDMADQADIKKCFHYSNLQPLWAKDNMSKGKK